MSDAEGGSPARCPWCSAELPAVLPATAPTTCPSCGAALTSATTTEPDIRGVTTLDHEAILRARSEMSRPRGRLLSFITGDTTTTAPLKPEELASLAPPEDAVRREMMRLELEAQRAELEAESVALRTEAVIDQGLDLLPGDDAGEQADEDAAGGDAAGGDAAGEVAHEAARGPTPDAAQPPAGDASAQAPAAPTAPEPSEHEPGAADDRPAPAS
jgi:hypothetical protein